MKKSIAIMLILAIICTLSFTGCGEDSENSAESKNTAANSEGPKVTQSATSAPTAASTKSPETESAQTSQVKPTESAVQTETLATNTPATNPTSGNKTTAPTQAPTKVPTSKPTTTTQVTNAPNKTPATSISEPTKVPTTTEPTKGPTVTIDPTKDYSEWGNYGFENLLPAPLPFSELEWIGMKETYPRFSQYNLRPRDVLDPNGKGNFRDVFKEYVESLESYGYTVQFDFNTATFYASKKTETERIHIKFLCDGYTPTIVMTIT